MLPPHDTPEDFAYVIRAKTNAPSLLQGALQRLPRDVVCTGDYQPAERKLLLSRQMIGVCLDLGFSVLVLSRSPLVTRDLDPLQAVNERARAAVAFSVIAVLGSPGYGEVRQMERLAPSAEKRFAAMEQLARAGILTGTRFMPILPALCDDETNLAGVVRWTADHGGRFVLAGGLTLADQQRECFLKVLGERFPALLEPYTRLYPEGSYGLAGRRWRQLGLRIRELCHQAGIADRMPRPIIDGDRRKLNKRVVEALANRAHVMELHGESLRSLWAYRKGAWAVEDLEQDIGLVYRTMGIKGLQSIQGVGPGLAHEVEVLVNSGMQP
jgi:DNA repair photolyase